MRWHHRFAIVLLSMIAPAAIAASPAISSIVSSKIQGSAGTFDLPLSATLTTPTIEPRNGPNHTIVFAFDRVVVSGTATVTEGIATVATTQFSGPKMIVNLTGVTNQQYVTVSVSAVQGGDGSTNGAAAARIGFLLGDVNQNGNVSLADLGLTNAQIAQIVTSANFLKDVNASGTLSLADKGFVNTMVATAIAPPPARHCAQGRGSIPAASDLRREPRPNRSARNAGIRGVAGPAVRHARWSRTSRRCRRIRTWSIRRGR